MNLLTIFGLTDDIIADELSIHRLQISQSGIDNAIKLATFLAHNEYLSAYESGIILNPLFESTLRRFYATGDDTHLSFLKALVSMGSIKESIRTGAARFSERGKDGLPIDSITFDHVIGQIFTIRGRTYGSDTISQILAMDAPKDPFTGEPLTPFEISTLRDELIFDGAKHLSELRNNAGSPDYRGHSPIRISVLTPDYEEKKNSEDTITTPLSYRFNATTPPPIKRKDRRSN